jgi:hypothetical protein
LLVASPLEASLGAMVYRRRLRQVPRDRLLRVFGWVGTILIHLLFLFGVVLGPAYEPPPSPPDTSLENLQVRLIDKPQPPIPPVRGTPSKAPVAATRRTGTTGASVAASSRRSSSSSSNAMPSVPTLSPPQVTPDLKIAAPTPNVVATPEKPVALPTAPPPQPDLQPVPQPDQAKPDFAMDTPLNVPVPPAFQPEPVRKPQAEGNQPMPPPPSLATPLTPPSQPDLKPSPPTLVADTKAAAPTTTMTIAHVPRPEVETSQAEPTPDLPPLPLTAPQPTAPPVAAKVDVPTVPTPTRPQMQGPVTPAPPELAAVPDTSSRPTVEAPKVQVDRPAVSPSAVTQPTIERPVATTAPAESSAETKASNESAANATAPEQASASAGAAAQPAPSEAASQSASTAAGAAAASGTNTPTAAAATGKPGELNGVTNSTRLSGQAGTTAGATPTAGQNAPAGAPVGDYIQLKPRGNTDVMDRNGSQVKYQATRFDQDWTPEGESSVDTALRHAVEKTTVKHTFNLPRGVRIECKVMPLLPMALFGCGNGDPPPKAVADKAYKPLKLAPAKPLVAGIDAPASAASTAPAVVLDNSSLCATAKVAGGPLPPECIQATQPQLRPTAGKPGDAWVPASDQFH